MKYFFNIKKNHSEAGMTLIIPILLLGILTAVGECVSTNNRFLIGNSKNLITDRSTEELKKFLGNGLSCYETLKRLPTYCAAATNVLPGRTGLYTSEFDNTTPEPTDKIAKQLVKISNYGAVELTEKWNFYLRAFCTSPKTFIVEYTKVSRNDEAEMSELGHLDLGAQPWKKLFATQMSCQ